LTNNDYRKKDKQVQRDTMTEALIVNDMSNDKKLEKDECAYCHKKGIGREIVPYCKTRTGRILMQM